ncbi:hypothetical protein AVEN_26750-1 [Araneus ventricosus]|uniref:Uncharacterized protein n=1 Tax=Araneus ventricosus TaxID=182803 RepID=A0A4Y2D6R5_ARAVE|nr:hypothetical protein AVEN_26750-1 [Araneus ventricosus]
MHSTPFQQDFGGLPAYQLQTLLNKFHNAALYTHRPVVCVSSTERRPMSLFLQPLQLPYQLEGHGTVSSRANHYAVRRRASQMETK